MTEIVVAFGRRMEGVDSARVWAFVADPANIERWAPVRRADYMGTELPGVGHTLFLRRTRRKDPGGAWRFRIDAWEAGHRVRCSLQTPGAAHSQEVEIIVGTEGTGAKPAASVRIVYRGDVPDRTAPLYRWRIAALERRAVKRIFDTVGAM